MQTQRDHVHAHQFMMGRLGSALVAGDPTSAEIPGRRPMTGLFGGLLVLVLVLAGFTVYGFIVPGGNKAYTQPKTVVVEKETGDRFIYFGGALHPVPNLTTAELAMGPGITVKLISRNSIKDVPRGRSIGLPGWPSSILAGTSLVRGPWLVCLGPGGDALGVDIDPGVPSTPLPDDRFAVVQDPAGQVSLLAHGRRYRVRDDDVLTALGLSDVRPTVAPRMWLGWLPEGPALAAPHVPGYGDRGSLVGGKVRTVGTLFRQPSTGGGEQLFVLLADGLAPVGRTEALLIAARNGAAPVELDGAAVVAAAHSADRSLAGSLPDLSNLHRQDPGSAILCQRQAPTAAGAVASSLVTVASGPAGTGSVSAGTGPGSAGTGSVLAGTGSAAAGAGSAPASMVIAAPDTAMAAIGVGPAGLDPAKWTGARVTFISGNGTAYPVADAATAKILSLTGALVPLPSDLLASLPQGPALSRDAAVSVTAPAEG